MIGIILFYFSFLIVASFAYRIDTLQKRILFQVLVCFIMMFVFFSFRDTIVINDTSHYYAHLYKYLSSPSQIDESIFSIDSNERFEYLYVVYEKFIGKYIWNDPYSIIFFSSTIISIFYLWIIKRYTSHIAICCFFAFSNIISSHNTIRNTIAVMLFMIGIEYLKKHHILKYYILIAIAFFFHSSAIVLIIIPILKIIPLTKKNIILTFIATLLISIFIYPLMILMGHEDSSYFLEMLNRESLPLAAIINTFLIAIYLLIVYYIKIKYNIIFPNALIIWLAIINFYVNIIAIPFLILARFSAYFSMYSIFILLYSLYHNSKTRSYRAVRRKSILNFLILLLFSRFCFTNAYKNEWANLYPYKFYDFKGGYRKEVHTTPDN